MGSEMCIRDRQWVATYTTKMREDDIGLIMAVKKSVFPSTYLTGQEVACTELRNFLLSRIGLTNDVAFDVCLH